MLASSLLLGLALLVPDASATKIRNVRIKQIQNGHYDMKIVVIVKGDDNDEVANVAAELEKHFGEKVYRTVVPRNIRLAEAPSHGIPALKLELQSKGAQAYLALAGEILRRMEARAAA